MDDAEQSSSEPPGRSTEAGSTIDILDDEHRLDEWGARWLAAHALEAIEQLGARGDVRIRLLDDEAMSAAHERHTGLPGPTDVLTFDLSDAPGVLDADLLLGFGVARREAEARSIRVERELLLYVVHGVLHCLGHDDHDPDRAKAMHRVEDETLEAIGVGATFASPGRVNGETTT